MNIMSIMGAQARISSPGILEAAHIFAVLGCCCPTFTAILCLDVRRLLQAVDELYGLQRHLPSSRSTQAIRCILKASLWGLDTGESAE